MRRTSRRSSHISSAHTSLLSSNATPSSELRKELATHIADISILSHRNEDQATKLKLSKVYARELESHVRKLEARLDASEARRQLSDAMLDVSNAHATIRNSENLALRRQLVEKTRTRKKCKINTEGCIITPLDGAALFAQQDAERQEKQANEDAKQKSKTDAIRSREHERVLAVGTKVFANPLASYNHKDDLLDIIAALGLDRAGVRATLRRGHSYTKILRDRGELNRCDTLTQW